MKNGQIVTFQFLVTRNCLSIYPDPTHFANYLIYQSNHRFFLYSSPPCLNIAREFINIKNHYYDKIYNQGQYKIHKTKKYLSLYQNNQPLYRSDMFLIISYNSNQWIFFWQISFEEGQNIQINSGRQGTEYKDSYFTWCL